MTILDRYILRELTHPFLFGICAFSTMFIGGGTMWRIAQYISKYGASGTVVLKLFLYSLPGVIVITFPMAMLLASLLCFGRLSGCGEIIAMKAGGRSFYRLILPVFLFAFAVSLFAAVFKDTVVPSANAAYNYLVHNEVEKNSRPKGQEHIVMLEHEAGVTRLTYARRYDEASGSLTPVTVQEFENDRLVRIQQAEKATWQDDHWTMFAGVINDLTSENDRTLSFQQQHLPPKKTVATPLEQKQPEEMTIRELKQRIALLRSESTPAGLFETELHQRLSIPLATLVFALVGAPLGIAPNRSSSSIGLGISILVIFVYYVIMTYTTSMAQSGILPAPLAAWIPNLLGLSAGALLIDRVAKR